MTKPILGIDLGATNSTAAYVDDRGQIVPIDFDGKSALPSVVQIKGDQIVVGESVLNQWLIDREHVVRWVKRSMGDPAYFYACKPLFEADLGVLTSMKTPDEETIPDDIRGLFEENGVTLTEDAVFAVIRDNRWIIESGDQKYGLRIKGEKIVAYDDFYTATRISAEILKVIKAKAEAQLCRIIDECVITCPDYFNTIEIENTKIAGELAGLTVNEIVQESVGAAIYYGVEHMKDGERIMVANLAREAFDATVLAYDRGSFQSIATMGDRKLGGHDWTSKLVELVADKCYELCNEGPLDSVGALLGLYEACEEAKRDFARVDRVYITCRLAHTIHQVEVSKQEFREQTESLAARVVHWCIESLIQAGLTWEDIDRILIIGGSARMNRIAEALNEASGKEPIVAQKPDLMVVNGAALIAARKGTGGGLKEKPAGKLTDISVDHKTDRSLGMRVYNAENDCITSVEIIPRGTDLPATLSKDFQVSIDGQECFDIPMIEFDNAGFDTIKNYRFGCSPDVKRGERVRITFHYSKAGILSAEAYNIDRQEALSAREMMYEEPDPTKVTVTMRPRWVVFALDISDSMEGEKLANTKQAIITNARDLFARVDGDCQVGIVTFSNEANVVCQPTSDIHMIEQCMKCIEAKGSTQTAEGIRTAFSLFSSAPSGADKDLVLIMGSMPDDLQDTQDAVDEVRAGGGVWFACLGIGSENVDEDYLKSLAPSVLVIENPIEISKDYITLLTMVAAI